MYACYIISVNLHYSEVSRRRTGSTADFPRPRHQCCQVMQLPHSSVRHIRLLLTQSAAQTLACILVNSRLDYCNSLLLGAPAMSLNRLQRAQNIAARVVMDAHRRTEAKPLLRQLHWLPVRQRILFKMAVLTRKAHTTGTIR